MVTTGGLSHRELVSCLDQRLPRRPSVRIHLPELRRSAVAILLVERGGATHVPFIVRASGLRAHSGQIALPGGVCDPGEDAAAAARRETYEELGVATELIRPLGLLDDVATPSGFVITPVVCELAEVTSYQPNLAEVTSVFEAPLAILRDPAIREEMGERVLHGRRERLHAYRYGEHRIWGATARIIAQLFALLD
jgi:8-oxo-dGTP pyrophosphatase MutT (NUDIX family)